MNEYDAQRQNIESSLKVYRESLEILEERFEGESDTNVIQNSQCVLDGLAKVVSLKEIELSEYNVQMKNLEEKNKS